MQKLLKVVSDANQIGISRGAVSLGNRKVLEADLTCAAAVISCHLKPFAPIPPCVLVSMISLHGACIRDFDKQNEHDQTNGPAVASANRSTDMLHFSFSAIQDDNRKNSCDDVMNIK